MVEDLIPLLDRIRREKEEARGGLDKFLSEVGASSIREYNSQGREDTRGPGCTTRRESERGCSPTLDAKDLRW